MAVDFGLAANAGFMAFGRPATFEPGDDAAICCTVITRTPQVDGAILDAGFRMSAGAQEIAIEADVRRSEVCEPRKGARITVEGLGTYEVVREPILDSEKLVWTLPLREVR